MRNFLGSARRFAGAAQALRPLLREVEARHLSSALQRPVLAGEIARRKPEFKKIEDQLRKKYHSAVMIGGSHTDHGMTSYALQALEYLIKNGKINPKELAIGWELEAFGIEEIKGNDDIYRRTLAIAKSPKSLITAVKEIGIISSGAFQYALVKEFSEKYGVPIFELEGEIPKKEMGEIVKQSVGRDPNIGYEKLGKYIQENAAKRAAYMAQNIIKSYDEHGRKRLICFIGFCHCIELAEAVEKIFPEAKTLSVLIATLYMQILLKRDNIEEIVEKMLIDRELFMNKGKHVDLQRFEELKKTIEIIEKITIAEAIEGLSKEAKILIGEVLSHKKPSPNPKNPLPEKGYEKDSVIYL